MRREYLGNAYSVLDRVDVSAVDSRPGAAGMYYCLEARPEWDLHTSAVDPPIEDQKMVNCCRSNNFAI